MNKEQIQIALQAGLNAMTFKEQEFTVSKKEVENVAIELIRKALKDIDAE